MRHVFYIPASYAALIYALVTGCTLLCCLYMGFILHSREILTTSCGEDHYEFWPSISATIGDMMPERQTWRTAFVLCSPFRIAATMSTFNVFWQKASRGMADLYSLRGSWRAFLGSTAFLALLVLFVDLWRLIGAVVWTMVASYESLPYHNLGFCPYIFFCFVLQVTVTTLVRRNRYNMAIYPTQQDAAASLSVKRFCLWGESIASVGVVCCYAYHFSTCANGSFSMSNMFEWTFGTCNIVFDGSAWFDLKQEGWWLSGSPGFYRKRWARRQVNGVTGTPKQVFGALGSTTSANGVRDGDAAVAVPPPLVPTELEAYPTSDRDGSIALPNGDDVGSAAGGEDGVPLTSPPRTTTGEFFLDHDVILHRFSFCSAPSRLLLWLCDIYWAHLFFEMVAHLVQHMYFMPLIAMSLSWEVCSVLVLGAPCLLRIPAFRRWATGPCPFARTWLKPSHVPIGLSYRTVPMYVMFYALAVLTHLHQLVRADPGKKILVVAMGPLFLSLALYARFLYPSTVSLKRSWVEGNEDSRRMTMALPLGLVLCMLLRVQHAGVSPFFTDPFYGSVYGILLGFTFTTVIYRHAMMGNTLKEETTTQQQQPQQGSGSSSTPRSGRASVDAEELRQVGPGDVSGSRGDTFGGARDERKSLEGSSTRGVHFSLSQADEVSENTVAAVATLYTPPSPALLGVLFGSITSIGITFFNSANYIPRLLAVEPFPANLLIAGVFTAGLYYSTDVLPVALVLLRPRRRPDVVRRLLHSTFAGSWARFGVFFLFNTCLMLFATRQTNFTYEIPHDGYPVTMSTPREHVDVKYWEAQESFWGSKEVAFLGGLGFTFCVGVLFPFVMEVTWAHQRDRRFALVANAMDADAAISRECRFFASFEFAWLMCTIVVCALYALCISYPFVPMAWIVREKSRPLILAHVFVLYSTAAVVGRRIRGSRAVAATFIDVTAARKQRSIQLMVLMLILFSFAWVFLGRVTMGHDVTFPAHQKTAITFQNEVLHLHQLLIQLRKERNIMTDPRTKEFESIYYAKRFEDAVEVMGRNITSSQPGVPVDPKYAVGHLAPADRAAVWEAAKAMTFFSGAIWTVHFGLDNHNVDSFARMTEELRKTEASVIGLLESDSMHLTNGNRDMVDYISYHLGFRYTDYGPTALDNTYGCALITRYPILSVRRYVIPSPLGELACVIHAVLDVYGLPMHTYVGHFGNTEHWADGLLQSQFLGRLAKSNPGPSMWLGYLVTHPGMKERYQEYTDPTAKGKFRDSALDIYRHHPWTRLWERGGYEEEPPVTVTKEPHENTDFNTEVKLQHVGYLEEGMKVDSSFRRPPPDKPPRHFYYNDTGRYSTAHPRFEFVDRYCQYCLYKTGATADEAPEDAAKLQPYQVRLFDWWRIVDQGVEKLSDTEIQVIQLAFERRQ